MFGKAAPSEEKLTVPVSAPVPAPVITVAVKLTLWPNPDGLRLDVSVVVVALTTVAVPHTSMSSGVLMATLA